MTDCSMGKIHPGSVAEIQGDTFRFLPRILTLHAVHFATVYGCELASLSGANAHPVYPTQFPTPNPHRNRAKT